MFQLLVIKYFDSLLHGFWLIYTAKSTQRQNENNLHTMRLQMLLMTHCCLIQRFTGIPIILNVTSANVLSVNVHMLCLHCYKDTSTYVHTSLY